MKNKKTYYVYDEESVNYVEEKVTPKRIVKRVFLYLLGGVVVSVGVMAFLYFGYDTQETAQLKNRKSELDRYAVRANAESEELARRVEELKKKDEELKEQILGVKEDQIGVERDSSGALVEVTPESAEETLEKIEARIRAQEESYQEILNVLARNDEMLTHIPAIKPVKGEILAFFGQRIHPALKVRQMHPGIDFEAREGTKIFATGDGTIAFAGAKRRSHQGNVIEIDHGQGFLTRYAHLSDFEVRQGQKVKRGDLIGYSGRPSNGKGPHLHYEVLRDGDHVDPLDYLFREYSREQYLDLKKKAQLDGESMD